LRSRRIDNYKRTGKERKAHPSTNLEVNLANELLLFDSIPPKLRIKAMSPLPFAHRDIVLLACHTQKCLLFAERAAVRYEAIVCAESDWLAFGVVYRDSFVVEVLW
jgi:hypothetical protein